MVADDGHRLAIISFFFPTVAKVQLSFFQIRQFPSPFPMDADKENQLSTSITYFPIGNFRASVLEEKNRLMWAGPCRMS